jgi:hypothetical protein
MKQLLAATLAIATLAHADEPDDWITLATHGFEVEAPIVPTRSATTTEWPGFGALIGMHWEARPQTRAQPIDLIDCWHARDRADDLFRAVHASVCKGRVRWDDTLRSSHARECLVLDGTRRTLYRVIFIGPRVCLVSSSERFAGGTDQASIDQARFVGSFHATIRPSAGEPLR